MPVRVWVPSSHGGERPIDYPKGQWWTPAGADGVLEVVNLDAEGATDTVATFPSGEWKRVESYEDALPPVALPEPSESDDFQHREYRIGDGITPWPPADPAHPDGLPPSDKRPPDPDPNDPLY